MRINAVSQQLQSEFRKVESAKKTDKSHVSTKSLPVDKSDISVGAQRLSTTKASIETIAATISAQDDVRIDKISEVQEKIKNGFYNSPEFIDKLADKLLSEFGIKASQG